MSKKGGEIDGSQYKTIEEILQMNKRNTDRLKAQLEAEELAMETETVDGLRNAMKADIVNTNQKKEKFINSLHGGMIEEIKRNKGIRKVEIKVSIGAKIKTFLRNVFTKF